MEFRLKKTKHFAEMMINLGRFSKDRWIGTVTILKSALNMEIMCYLHKQGTTKNLKIRVLQLGHFLNNNKMSFSNHL